jgi:hypothetical protein
MLAEIRAFVQQNSRVVRGEVTMPDPQAMAAIDEKYPDPLFFCEDNIYTREELCRAHPLLDKKAKPEDLFKQQEIGVFPPAKYAMEDKLEYLSRDVGDTEPFIAIEDMVGQATRVGYSSTRSPIKVIRTKLYKADDKWKSFVAATKMLQTFSELKLLGGPGGGVMGLLMDDETRERERKKLAEVERKMAEMEARYKREMDDMTKKLSSAMKGPKRKEAPIKLAPNGAAHSKPAPNGTESVPNGAAHSKPTPNGTEPVPNGVTPPQPFQTKNVHNDDQDDTVAL